MLAFEKISQAVRHAPGLRRLEKFWSIVRPIYNGALDRLTGGRGVPRCINGTDPIRLLPDLHSFSDTYEPELWKCIMEKVSPGGRVVDVGANIGLYAIAIAKRVGAGGHVIAVEPDPGNVKILRDHLALNGVTGHVDLVEAALSSEPGTARLHIQQQESRLTTDKSKGSEATIEVPVKTLDEVTANQKIDLLLIDVEGFEESVLRGGRELLSDRERRPAYIFLEAHPFAWPEIGATSDSLLATLNECGYTLTSLAGDSVGAIDSYGHFIAIASVNDRA